MPLHSETNPALLSGGAYTLVSARTRSRAELSIRGALLPPLPGKAHRARHPPQNVGPPRFPAVRRRREPQSQPAPGGGGCCDWPAPRGPSLPAAPPTAHMTGLRRPGLSCAREARPLRVPSPAGGVPAQPPSMDRRCPLLCCGSLLFALLVLDSTGEKLAGGVLGGGAEHIPSWRAEGCQLQKPAGRAPSRRERLLWNPTPPTSYL